MEDVDRLKERLDALRPLRAEHLSRLWPAWEKEDALHVYATNAIEGSTMDLGETLAILEDGITVGGKKLSEHLDIIHGQRAYMLMLRLAKDKASVTTAIIRTLHQVVVGKDEAFAGQWRDHPVYIRGSRRTPPDNVKVPELMDALIDAYDASEAKEHPIARAAKLHFALSISIRLPAVMDARHVS
jgi:Fic family protein